MSFLDRLIVLILVVVWAFAAASMEASSCARSSPMISAEAGLVLCCCPTYSGGICCKESSFCSGFILGCNCQQ